LNHCRFRQTRGIPMQHGPLPAIGEDRGCAAPYQEFMAAELAK